MNNLTNLFTRLAVYTITLALAGFSQAQIPHLIHYQGQVKVNGTPFTGQGLFKFALVNFDGTQTHWSNDSTSNSGSEPTDAIQLPVLDGQYSVLLGDVTTPNMTILPPTLFGNSNIFLRTWFDDGSNGSQQLSPDKQITAVAYAIIAETVAEGGIGSQQLASNLTLSGATSIERSLDIASTTGPDDGLITVDGTRLIHTFGDENFSAGKNAGSLNDSGFHNTTVGFDAFPGNTTGTRNTAIGARSLTSNREGNSNTAVGVAALQSNLNANNNTAVGTFALESNTTGESNTAIGGSALTSNNSGQGNTAAGINTLHSNTDGSANTAVGANALHDNRTGSSNTALGNVALSKNTSAQDNTAVGSSALRNNVTGANNTAAGSFAHWNNLDGSSNTAIGANTLGQNQNGSANTAVGEGALNSNKGSRNTAVGSSSGGGGNDNISLGYTSGQLLGSAGQHNITIGNRGDRDDSSTIRIGDNDNHNRLFLAGARGTTTGLADAIPVLVDSEGQFGTVSSSRRYKENIAPMSSASERLRNLNPVTFRYRKAFRNGETPLQFGLIAEEVAEVFPELAVYNDRGEPETVKYHVLAPLLLNEFQKLVTENEGLKAIVADQDTGNKALADRLERLEAIFGE